MAIGEFRIRINNRKLLKGLLEGYAVPKTTANAVLRALDKIEKEETAKIRAELEREGMRGAEAARLYELIATRRTTAETLAALQALGMENETYRRGLAELTQVVGAIGQFGVPEAAFAIDLGVVRGLDYYTGTIYETSLVNSPELGSICSGGRYDDLASAFTDTRLPGVGISIGLTRLFSRLKEAGLLRAPARTPAEALVTTLEPRYLDRYLAMAGELRRAGVNTEVYLETAKLKNQLAYANRKRFRIALIAGETEFARNCVQVKNLATGTAAEVALADATRAVQDILKN
jgi:histidyl-tRNA synthetase